jgi:hypothetical protein
MSTIKIHGVECANPNGIDMIGQNMWFKTKCGQIHQVSYIDVQHPKSADVKFAIVYSTDRKTCWGLDKIVKTALTSGGLDDPNTNIELIRKAFKFWTEIVDEEITTLFSIQDCKYIFLSEQILGFDTYSRDLDLQFGRMFLEVMVVIETRTNHQYIKSAVAHHKNYVMACHFLKNCIEYGTSLRGAWFDYNDGKIYPDFCLSNISGHTEDFIKIDEPFMKWFINFIQGKEE